MPWAAHDDSLCIWLMPKTGSSFVEEVAASCIKGKRWQQQHDPAMLMLGDGIWAALRGARNYGTTRHPLTWYASLYRHACRWKLGTPTFKDWLLPRLNMPYEGIDAQYPGTIWQIREEALANLPLRGGLWSWTVRYMYSDWDHEGAPRWLVDFIPLEDVYSATSRIFGTDVQPRTHKPKNTAARREALQNNRNVPPRLSSYEEWYDETLLRAVQNADSEAAALLGYPL